MEDTLQITGLESLISPEPVAAWPPAPGWIILAGILFLALVAAFTLYLRKRNRNRYRRIAITRINRLRDNWKGELLPEMVRELNHLLKQAALRSYPRERVAALHGLSWIRFMKESDPFLLMTREQEMLLSLHGYRKQAEPMEEQQWDELLEVCSLWIRKHQTGRKFSSTNQLPQD